LDKNSKIAHFIGEIGRFLHNLPQQIAFCKFLRKSEKKVGIFPMEWAIFEISAPKTACN